MINYKSVLLAVLLMTGCNEESGSKTTAGEGSGGGGAAAVSASHVVYPADTAYTEGDTGQAYWLFSGANAQGQMGDFNSRWRTILLRFDISTLSNTSNARLYIFRDNSNDAPAVGFDPFGALSYLHAEKIRPDALVPGMGRADIWFYGADWTVPVPIGNLANDNAAYMTNNAALSVDITNSLNESITNHDAFLNVRIRHTGNTANGVHRVDFHLRHSQSHPYKPYLEIQ